MPNFSITGWSLLVQAAVGFIAGIVALRHYRQQSEFEQNNYWVNFLLLQSTFFFILFLPHLSLEFDQAIFSRWMVVGYVVGHFFLYLALAYLARLITGFTYRLHNWQRQIFYIFVGLAMVGSLINGLFPPEPVYNAARNVVEFNAPAPTSIFIGAMAFITYVPLGVLFIRSGRYNPARLKPRPYLLGFGLILLFLLGPLHNFASSVATYLLADIGTTVAFGMITLGVVWAPTSQQNVANADPQSVERTISADA